MLDPKSLSESFGTSVAPVRNALQMLSQDGLVTIKPRWGCFVTRMTLKQLCDLLELRKIFESAAVERATSPVTEEQLGQLDHVHGGYADDDDESYDRYTKVLDRVIREQGAFWQLGLQIDESEQ